MSFFDDVIANTTLTAVRTTVIGYAQAAELTITEWIVGGPGQQIFEAVTGALYSFVRDVAKITRGVVSLDTSTDPGDPDAYDPTNEGQPAAPGFLSNFGKNTCGTTRAEETFASGFATLTNSGAGAQVRRFGPQALVFTWTANTPPSPAPTYRNTSDTTIYTNPDGTVTLAVGATLTIPVVAEERGTRSNTPSSSLSLTTTLVGCTASNGAAILAVNREDAEVYRGRCRQAAARLSFAGPADAIAYLAAKTLDGEPLTNELGNVTNINRAQVTNDSATGIVNAYYASPSGPATDEDVTAANDNIELNAYAVTDVATFTGAKALGVPITMAGSARVRAGAGVSVLAVRSAIVGFGDVEGALPTAFESFPIGGKDQVAGAGVIYTVDLQAIVAGAFPGLYDVVVSTPAGASTAILAGGVPTLVTSLVSWSITVVP